MNRRDSRPLTVRIAIGVLILISAASLWAAAPLILFERHIRPFATGNGWHDGSHGWVLRARWDHRRINQIRSWHVETGRPILHADRDRESGLLRFTTRFPDGSIKSQHLSTDGYGWEDLRSSPPWRWDVKEVAAPSAPWLELGICNNHWALRFHGNLIPGFREGTRKSCGCPPMERAATP